LGGNSVAAPKRKLGRAQRIRRVIPLTILLLVALLAFFFIAARVARAVLEVRNAEQVRNGAEVGVRPWMTIPYIARAYGVPESDLYSVLGLTPSERERRAPLGAIAKRNGRNLDADLATLNTFLAERPPAPKAPAPSAPPPPPGRSP
jgi:hypothetical protein